MRGWVEIHKEIRSVVVDGGTGFSEPRGVFLRRGEDFDPSNNTLEHEDIG